jgi:8-oxo-dGTP pyrophosphatase MutT (NUDIX family)
MADGSSVGSRDSNPWSQISRTKVYENDWIIVYHDNVVRPDGQPGVYGVVHYRSRSVGVVALDDLGRVLLVGQYRYTLGQYSWELPAGGSAEDEEPQAAALRELEEETGYSAATIRPILRAHMSNSISDEEALCYLASGFKQGTPKPEGTEDLRIIWVSLDKAMRMIAAGEITDALTILRLQQAALMVRAM